MKQIITPSLNTHNHNKTPPNTYKRTHKHTHTHTGTLAQQSVQLQNCFCKIQVLSIYSTSALTL